MKQGRSAVVREILEWIECALIALVVAVLFKYYIGSFTIVKQTSMYPTLKNNDRLVLNCLYKTLKTIPQRGDIVTFEAPSVNYLNNNEVANIENPVAIYENEPNGRVSRFFDKIIDVNKIYYIKRIIGLPGEHIQIKDGKIYVNGEELQEDYLTEDIITDSAGGGQFLDIIVPEGTYFMVGDNREHSMDSRRFGCIPYEKIRGKVILRWWPFNSFGNI